MLTRPRRARRQWAALAALCLSIAAASVVVAAPADAAGCVPPEVKGSWDPVNNRYSCIDPGTTDPGTDNPSTPTGPSAPSCNLGAAGDLVAEHADRRPSSPFCRGKETCILIEHHAPWAVPATDKPSENAEMRVRWCRLPDGGSVGLPVWEGEDEPPLIEQAQQAIGQIVLPTPQLSTSPVTRSVVNLDTWFWVDGQPRETTGSSAFGLVAIATFGSLQVDPGDGSGTQACPLVTSEAAAERDCFHIYDKSSHGGSGEVDGRPAFAVTATATFDLRFEVDGEPVAIDGAPATLTGPAAEVDLRVDEVQTVVTDVR